MVKCGNVAVKLGLRERIKGKRMNCLNCGASINQYGIYKGSSIIYCTQCGMDFDYHTGEILLRGTREAVSGASNPVYIKRSKQ